MPKYATLFKLSNDAVGRMIEKPSDRVAAVSRAAESAGGKLVDYYWMFGQYDGIAIFEFPDSAKLASLMIAVAGRGAVTDLETHELIEASDIEGLLAKSKGITYSPPGA
jgi:uncharacterized protein with GYD domain